MSFRYDEIVPWGRSFHEYRQMFHLYDSDLDLKIIGCGDGPASFNCEMKLQGKHVVSVDPLYQYSEQQIRTRINQTFESVISQTRENQDKFLWQAIPSVEALGSIRMAAMERFLSDYTQGKSEGRYVCGQLPKLPFGNAEFELALCSHLLFLYSDNLSLDFHIQAIEEMCRIAKEVRIFPLLDVNAEPSPYVEEIIKEFKAQGKNARQEQVGYEFQKNGNQMLKIT
jgi:hypothetical protein